MQNIVCQQIRVLLKAAPAAPAAPATINDTYCSGPRVSFFSEHMKISRRYIYSSLFTIHGKSKMIINKKNNNNLTRTLNNVITVL